MTFTNDEVFDISVIGGGPVGLFAAFYTGLRDMDVKIIDSLPKLGGQPGNLYPEKYIYDVAGFSKISGKELTEQLIKQMKVFQPTICIGETVQDVEKLRERLFKLTTDKSVHYAKSVLITSGIGAFQLRKLTIQQTSLEEENWVNLHYFVTKLNRFKDKHVCICGGGDSAVDLALMIEPIAKSVTVIHRREKFRAHEQSVQMLKQSSARILTPYQPVEFIGKDKQIHQLVVKEVQSDVV